MVYRPVPPVPSQTPLFEEGDEERLTQTWLRWFQRIQQLSRRVEVYRPTLTATSVAAQSTNEQTFTVAGLTTDDVIVVNKITHQSGLSFGNVRVSAADTLAIQYLNTATAAVTPTSEAYRVATVRG